MDYSKLSDRDIDALVLQQIYGNQASDKDIVRSWLRGGFKYTTNPADAWPIIQGNGISIDYDGIDWMAYHCSCASIKYSNPIEEHPGKPLRAAMIVFLMMKESLHA
ncbi:DUF2591 family protein [Cronobacter dublinensis]